LAKHVIFGLLAVALASPALAGDHYVEVWNPPEARGMAAVRPKQPAVSAHRPLKRRRVSISAAKPRHHRDAVTAGPRVPAPVAASHAATPTFDDIPRQITPEGNVLRVKGGQAHAEVER
jgi:hypothetical protein